MELSRRDALAALAALGATAGAYGARDTLGAVAGRSPPVADDEASRVPADVASLMVAASEVLYPSAVEGNREFVETYLDGRLRDETYRSGLEATLSDLDAVARDWFGDSFAALTPETRDQLLRELGADVADADPTGTLSDRVRFFVVNDLLYALYTSPTGGRLVGTENPTGYPGGTESYQRGPDAVDGGGSGE